MYKNRCYIYITIKTNRVMTNVKTNTKKALKALIENDIFQFDVQELEDGRVKIESTYVDIIVDTKYDAIYYTQFDKYFEGCANTQKMINDDLKSFLNR